MRSYGEAAAWSWTHYVPESDTALRDRLDELLCPATEHDC
jgi:hypothetical protein